MVVSLRRTLAFAVAGLVCVAGSAAAQNGTISGRVTDADGGQPVVGATVQALTSARSPAGGAMTNDEGQYRFSVAPGTYTVSARRIAYGETERRNVVVGPGKR